MSRACAAGNCAETTAGYSQYCERHKRTVRRHGHANQTAITVAELKPYRERIAARRKKNPHSPAWGILGQRWGTVVEAAERTVAAYSRGQAAVRGDVLAAGHIQRLAVEAPSETVIDTALAMFLLREARPHRFKSDKAFNFELVRRVRALAESNAGTYFDQPSGKVKRVYRDILPGTMERLAVSLTEAFGAAGLQLAALDQRDEERRAAEGAKLMAALKDLA
jgi:hypothetical protein